MNRDGTLCWFDSKTEPRVDHGPREIYIVNLGVIILFNIQVKIYKLIRKPQRPARPQSLPCVVWLASSGTFSGNV